MRFRAQGHLLQCDISVLVRLSLFKPEQAAGGKAQGDQPPGTSQDWFPGSALRAWVVEKPLPNGLGSPVTLVGQQ